jgi:hypothetical protein
MQKRKQILVERKVQGALGARIACHWFAFMAISLLVTTFLNTFGNVEQPTLWDSLRLSVLNQVPSLAVLFALLPWFIHDALKLSNRFAGPMVRLRNSIRLLTEGSETPALRFRKGDFWGEVADDFNRLQRKLLLERQRIADLEEQLEGQRSTASV